MHNSYALLHTDDSEALPPARLRIEPGAVIEDADFDALSGPVKHQPDVARGIQQRETVEEMGRRLSAELPLDAILVCYHDDRDECDCRKPKPGLMLSAAQQYAIDLSRSYMIGDRWRDIDAGANAGCKTIWIDRGYAERGPTTPADARVSSLTEAVDWILQNDGKLT